MGRTAAERVFGHRRIPPLPPISPSPPFYAPFLQACTAYLQELKSRPAALWRRIAFSWVYLQALIELRTPRRIRLSSLLWPGKVMLTVLRVLARWTLALLRRSAQCMLTALFWLFRFIHGISIKAVLRALFWSDASATFARLIAYMGALALLAMGAEHFVRTTPILVTETESAPLLEWTSIAKPFPVFSIPMSELAESGQDYALRRHIGGGRQDILTWGELDSRTPHLMVEVYRPGSERGAFASAQEEIATRLENLDLVELKAAGEMETKFGTASLVEFSLGKPARQCLGFVRAHDDPQLQILGWHCGRETAPAERDVLACAIDRLALVSAGSEPKLREFFARAEMRRHFCGQRSHLLTPTPKHGPSAPAPKNRPNRLAG